jgi:hypothetical protein
MKWSVAVTMIGAIGMRIVCGLSLDFEIQTQPRIVVDAYESRRYLRQDPGAPPHAPLYRGMGTHFIYLWVGTPSQRVSVIVDTGSHYTAFPCKGCTNCGTHTDHYWDPKSSSTSHTELCGGNQQCKFSQSYTEGSSWQAYKVTDVVWIGGERADMLEKLPKYSVNFTFGCQTSETGLFRTQVENGIMGLSSDPNTLPHVLHAKHLLPSRSFSLCLLSTGGLMSIGEEEQEDQSESKTESQEEKTSEESHHSEGKTKKKRPSVPSSPRSALNLHPMKYAQLVSKSGYYTVYVESILFKMTGGGAEAEAGAGAGAGAVYHELGEPKVKLNTGKGIIVDSGTTDSYLPASIAASFRKVFQKLTGIIPTNNAMALTQEQHRHLPTIVYRVTASPSASLSDEKTIDIEFPPWNYLELQKDGRYVLRLYLTEGSGGVIGANMMVGHNILFQPDKQRIGFAKSECQRSGEPLYDEVTKPKKISP